MAAGLSVLTSVRQCAKLLLGFRGTWLVQLTRRCEYALLALIDLAVEGAQERVQLKDIAARQQIPEKYLEQLLRPLRTAGVVVSSRGSRGGYQLAMRPDSITVLAVYEAIEGPLDGELESPQDHHGLRVIRELWQREMAAFSDRLGSTCLEQLVRQYQASRSGLDDWVI